MTVASQATRFAHDHIFLGASHDANARRTLWVVALTATMMVGEIITGYLTGSMALLADGFHMATHAGALSVAAIAYSYAKRHASDRRFSFGTGKVGDLAGFASALVLAVIAIGIGVESVVRLFQPITVAFTEAAIVAVIGLAVNVVSAFLLAGDHSHGHGHGHSHGHGHHDHAHDDHREHPVAGMRSQDNNLRAAYVHVLADALTSVLAIIALLSGRFLGWVWLDPVMGIVGALVIARWSWSLMLETAWVLLDRTDEHIAEEIRALVETPGDARIADLHVWRVGPDARAGIVSVVADDTVDRAAVQKRLKPVHELRHLTIEVQSI
ncbi:cation diffusion facilitator family transporter [Sphingobium wenxiniae]|jgi:cation diffusion facilitator family transporter|uniref:Cation diffusion facilitator family transporter n=1 Tax=Sphingobium wenxiniae (strain DSM 21828 / CGMCC 1.7748 / JZ-1) TaxID=595605 RepID=A0A562K976_SPHWJ|nr:CDF family Co(II)/Ni(II) efflux transporter DmeF [Sphingobium wenxiniae]MBB6192326.1 cation diffusion facilitator family transporter [Sphingobium wenxiniae]TWH91980.1 cation diffusion facilitator family transporter [Sphingobium wenxiniae]